MNSHTDEESEMVVLWLAACTVTVDGETVLGEPLVSETRQLDSFAGLSSESSIDVVVRVGEGPREVVVRAKEGQLDSVRTEVVDGQLQITSDSGVFSRRRLTVTVPTLESVVIASSGDVEVEGLSGDPLRVSGSGSGDLVLQGVVGDLDLLLSSTGDAEASEVQGAVRARVTGSGDLELDGRITGVDAQATSTGDIDIAGIDADLVEVQATSSGDIALHGRATRLVASLDSLGDIEAGRLTVQTAQVHSGGSGDLTVRATDHVEGRLTSMGDLTVSGGAATSVRTTGTGDVEIR